VPIVSAHFRSPQNWSLRAVNTPWLMAVVYCQLIGLPRHWPCHQKYSDRTNGARHVQTDIFVKNASAHSVGYMGPKEPSVWRTWAALLLWQRPASAAASCCCCEWVYCNQYTVPHNKAPTCFCTCLRQKSTDFNAVLTARRYASSGTSYNPLSVSVCVCLFLSVCHKSVFYRIGWTNRAVFWHGSFLRSVHCFVRKFRYLQK